MQRGLVKGKRRSRICLSRANAISIVQIFREIKARNKVKEERKDGACAIRETLSVKPREECQGIYITSSDDQRPFRATLSRIYVYGTGTSRFY